MIIIIWSSTPIAELKLAPTDHMILSFFLLNDKLAVRTSPEATHIFEEGYLLLVA